MPHKLPTTLIPPCLVYSLLLLFGIPAFGQKGSVVLIHTEGKSSGYGVAVNYPDRIVTALHIVANMGKIAVVFQNEDNWSYATIEKIYMDADLALLKLEKPLGLAPISLYSGKAPVQTNVNYWEIDKMNGLTEKNTKIQEVGTKLDRICSSLGIQKALCQNAGVHYPSMSTEIMRFGEPNIRKAHSGSPLTFNNKLIGLVDGGAKLANGKPVVWAISSESIGRLFSHGTAPPPMQRCGGVDGSAFMYSGMRSDNGFLTQEERQFAAKFEKPLFFQAANGNTLKFYLEERLSWSTLNESLFDDEKEDIEEAFEYLDWAIKDKVTSTSFDLYIEESTGISFVVPTGSHLSNPKSSFSPDEIIIKIASPGQASSQTFFIKKNATMALGMKAMSTFKARMAGYGYDMVPSSWDIIDLRDDPDNPYYEEEVSMNFFQNGKTDGNEDELIGGAVIKMMVENGNFFVNSYEVSDFKKLKNDPTEIAYSTLFQIGEWLSGFIFY